MRQIDALFTLLEAARLQSCAIRELRETIADLQQRIGNPTLVADPDVPPSRMKERRALTARRRLRQHRTMH